MLAEVRTFFVVVDESLGSRERRPVVQRELLSVRNTSLRMKNVRTWLSPTPSRDPPLSESSPLSRQDGQNLVRAQPVEGRTRALPRHARHEQHRSGRAPSAASGTSLRDNAARSRGIEQGQYAMLVLKRVLTKLTRFISDGTVRSRTAISRRHLGPSSGRV